MKKLVFKHLHDGSFTDWKADDHYSNICPFEIYDSHQPIDSNTTPHENQAAKTCDTTPNSNTKGAQNSLRLAHLNIFQRLSSSSQPKFEERRKINATAEKLIFYPVSTINTPLTMSGFNTNQKSLETQKTKHASRSLYSHRLRTQSLKASRMAFLEMHTTNAPQRIVNGKPVCIFLPLASLEQEHVKAQSQDLELENPNIEAPKVRNEETSGVGHNSFHPIRRAATSREITHNLSHQSLTCRQIVYNYSINTSADKTSWINKEMTRPAEEENKRPIHPKLSRPIDKSANASISAITRLCAETPNKAAEEAAKLLEKISIRNKSSESKKNFTSRKPLICSFGTSPNKSYRDFTPTNAFKTKFPFKQFSVAKLQKNPVLTLISRAKDKSQEGTVNFTQASVKMISSLFRPQSKLNDLSQDASDPNFNKNKQPLERCLRSKSFSNTKNLSTCLQLKIPSLKKLINSSYEPQN